MTDIDWTFRVLPVVNVLILAAWLLPVILS
jgi:hypothetical protein